jgi:hypothetical protein
MHDAWVRASSLWNAFQARILYKVAQAWLEHSRVTLGAHTQAGFVESLLNYGSFWALKAAPWPSGCTHESVRAATSPGQFHTWFLWSAEQGEFKWSDILREVPMHHLVRPWRMGRIWQSRRDEGWGILTVRSTEKSLLTGRGKMQEGQLFLPFLRFLCFSP